MVKKWRQFWNLLWRKCESKKNRQDSTLKRWQEVVNEFLIQGELSHVWRHKRKTQHWEILRIQAIERLTNGASYKEQTDKSFLILCLSFLVARNTIFLGRVQVVDINMRRNMRKLVIGLPWKFQKMSRAAVIFHRLNYNIVLRLCYGLSRLPGTPVAVVHGFSI